MIAQDHDLWAVGGWFGDFATDEAPEFLLSRMMGDASKDFRSCLVHIDRRASIFLGPGTPGRELVVDGRLCLAIFGNPWWSNAALEQTAQSAGHAAAALAAYRRWDRQLLDHLHGPFGLIVLDGQLGEAFVAIDRVGIQPMAYSFSAGKGIVFGTDATTVARHPAVGVQISSQAIFDYLFFYRVPAPGSIFRNVSKLLPGQAMRVRPDRSDTTFYWQMPFARTHATDRRALKEVALRKSQGGRKESGGRCAVGPPRHLPQRGPRQFGDHWSRERTVADHH